MTQGKPSSERTEGVGPPPDGRPATRVPVLLQELSLELNRFSHTFARQHGLHATDVDALGRLAQAEATGVTLTPSTLAAAVDLSAPATSALLNRLEQMGHVERAPDPHDRRRHRVSLHPQARTVASAFFGPLGAALQGAMAGLDAEEIAVVEGFLERAVEATRGIVHEAEVNDPEA